MYILAYNSDTGVIESRLILQLGEEPMPILRGTSWWCQVEYSILDDETVLTVVGDPVALAYKDRK